MAPGEYQDADEESVEIPSSWDLSSPSVGLEHQFGVNVGTRTQKGEKLVGEADRSMRMAVIHVVVIAALIIGAVALWIGGERCILSGLLKEGFKVSINEEVSIGDGYYTIEIRHNGSWVEVDSWVAVDR